MRELSMQKDPRIMSGDRFDSGNIAIAEGAIASGLGGYFGYPITPSTSIMEHVVKRFKSLNDEARFVQSEDEIASIMMTIGCSWTRTKSMTATSGPGFSLMQEGIGLASFTETPLVLANVQRGGPSTGLPTFPGQQELMQSRFGSHGDYYIPTLVPSSVQECFDLTVEAFNISEVLRTPVFVQSDQVLSSLKERFTIPPANKLEIINRGNPDDTDNVVWKGEVISESLVPHMNCFGEERKAFSTGLSHDETGHVDLRPATYKKLLERLKSKILTYQHLLPSPEIYNTVGADLIVISYGSTSRSVKAAMRLAKKEGINVGLFRPRTVWPFPQDQMRKIAGDKPVLVIEMSAGQLIWPVERFLYRKVGHLPYPYGRIPAPSVILEKIKEVLQ